MAHGGPRCTNCFPSSRRPSQPRTCFTPSAACSASRAWCSSCASSATSSSPPVPASGQEPIHPYDLPELPRRRRRLHRLPAASTCTHRAAAILGAASLLTLSTAEIIAEARTAEFARRLMGVVERAAYVIRLPRPAGSSLHLFLCLVPSCTAPNGDGRSGGLRSGSRRCDLPRGAAAAGWLPPRRALRLGHLP